MVPSLAPGCYGHRPFYMCRLVSSVAFLCVFSRVPVFQGDMGIEDIDDVDALLEAEMANQGLNEDLAAKLRQFEVMQVRAGTPRDCSYAEHQPYLCLCANLVQSRPC